MGTWNRNLFSNDTACDIKDTYIELLQNQHSDEEAYDMTCREYIELIGSDEEPIFWFAIAAIQWQVGRLTPVAKEKALYWIDANGGIDLWNETKKGRVEWKKTLLKLKEVLISDLPPKKEFKKAKTFETNLWDIGDVYAYQLNKKYSKDIGLYGKYILLHKISEDTSYESIIPRVQIYNKVFDELPSLDVINELTILPFANAISYTETCLKDRTVLPLNVAIIRHKENDYSPKHFTYIGNIKDTHFFPISNFNLSNCYWFELEECVCEFLPSWHEYDYFVKNGEIVVKKVRGKTGDGSPVS